MTADLAPKDFALVVENAPLVSIDLVVRDSKGRVLVGLRTNEPAKVQWFVPGGRVRKNESIADAFSRISAAELGHVESLSSERFLGCFENFYRTSATAPNTSGTHYVVLGFEITRDVLMSELPADQHSDWRWRDVGSLLADDSVHDYTKDLVREACLYPAASDRLDVMDQYQVVASRRDAQNALLWQTPVLSLTAQAFLFTIALDPSRTGASRAVAGFLALVTAVGSVQLLLKHRSGEVRDSVWLDLFERRHLWRGLMNVNRQPPAHPLWLVGLRSHRVWVAILILFAAASLGVLVELAMTALG